MKKILFISSILLLLFTFISKAQWQPDVRLTNDPAASNTSYNNARCIASNGNIIHVVWYDARDGNQEIYYKRSTDGGVNWSADTRLTNNPGSSGYPSIAVSGSFVHATWRENRDGNYEIYYKRSTDGGLSWGTDLRFTNNSATSGPPSVSVSGSVVHVVWHDAPDTNYEIYYKRSTDNGFSWETNVRLSNNSAESYGASVSAYGSFVQAVWHDARDGGWEIYYKRSTNAGVSWETETRLTNDPASSYYPSVSVSGSAVHVVWEENRDGNAEIYYKRSTDGGINWDIDTRLTNQPGSSGLPSVSASGSGVHVVWIDDFNMNPEIYYKRSADGGGTWNANVRITNNAAYSFYPSTSISGSIVHLVWCDERDGNREIYYKRDPTGNPIPPPDLISPPNGSQGQSLTPLLDWSTVTGAVTYRVQVTTDSTFTLITALDSSNVTMDSLRIPSGRLANNVKYFWRVNAANAGGTSPWSVIWNFRVGYIGLTPITNVIPKEYKLFNNYPNPFNPVTKIRFDVPSSDSRFHGNDNITLIIYDMLGREITTPVNQQLQPGTYEIDFDGTTYPSGVYYYTLLTEYFKKTKRMVLVK